MIDYDTLLSSEGYKSLDSVAKQTVKKKYLDEMSATQSFQSLPTPERERVVYHALFSDTDPEERKKQSESAVIQGLKGIYEAAKPLASMGAPGPAALVGLQGKYYEAPYITEEESQWRNEPRGLLPPKGTLSKITRMGGSFSVEAPLYAMGGGAVELMGGKILANLAKKKIAGKLAAHAIRTGLTMGGVEAGLTPGKVMSKQETLSEAPLNIAKQTGTGALLGVGGEVAGSMGGKVAEKFAPEFIKLSQKTSAALGMGGTMALTAPEGERVPSFLFGTVLGVAMPGGERDPRNEIHKVIRENLDYARTKGLRPSVVGKRTTPQQQQFAKAFDDIAYDIIARKGQPLGIDEQGNPLQVELPSNMSEYARAVDMIRREAGQKMTEIAVTEGKRGNIINTDGITENVLQPVLKKAATGEVSPEVATEASEWSQRFAQMGDLTPIQAENLISELNAKVNRNFRAGYFGRGTPSAFLNDLRANLRSTLMDSIERSTGSKVYEVWRQKWANATSLLNDANQRALVSSRAAPKGFFDLADMFSVAEGVRGGVKILFGDVQGGLLDLTKAGMIHRTKAWIKSLNNSDAIIRHTFKNVDSLLERYKTIDVQQKTASDVIRYLRYLPRESRQRIFAENPEFAEDLKATLKPLTAITFQPKVGPVRRIINETSGEPIAIPQKKLPYTPQPFEIQGKGKVPPVQFIRSEEMGTGHELRTGEPTKQPIKESAEIGKGFLQELWEDLNTKFKSEKGSVRIGSGKEENNPSKKKFDLVDKYGDRILKTSWDIETKKVSPVYGSEYHDKGIPEGRYDKNVRMFLDHKNKVIGTRLFASTENQKLLNEGRIDLEKIRDISYPIEREGAGEFIKENPDWRWIPQVDEIVRNRAEVFDAASHLDKAVKLSFMKDVGITTSSENIKEINSFLNKAREAIASGDEKSAEKYQEKILSIGRKNLDSLFSDIPDIKIEVNHTWGDYGGSEPTFETKIFYTDSKHNETLVDRLSGLGKKWKQDTIHISEELDRGPESGILGMIDNEGYSVEPQLEISFNKPLSTKNFIEFNNVLRENNLAGSTLRSDRKSVFIYNISRGDYGQKPSEFYRKIKQVTKALHNSGFQERFSTTSQGNWIERIDYSKVRRLLIIGNERSGATRTYESIGSKISSQKGPTGPGIKSLVSAGIASAGLSLLPSTAQSKEIISFEDKLKSIIGEAESEGLDGMRMVASAINNRGTLKGVYGKDAIIEKNGKYFRKTSKGIRIITKSVVEDAKKAIADAEENDYAIGADHWEGTKFKKPRWSNNMEIATRSKNQIFYRSKARR